MPSQKLVRCPVRQEAPKAAPTARYIPLEIFGLWDFLMIDKHGFDVIEPARVAVARHGGLARDRVRRASVRARHRGDGVRLFGTRRHVHARVPIFPRRRAASALKPIFLAHYRGARRAGCRRTSRERQGIWLLRGRGRRRSPSSGRAFAQGDAPAASARVSPVRAAVPLSRRSRRSAPATERTGSQSRPSLADNCRELLTPAGHLRAARRIAGASRAPRL